MRTLLPILLIAALVFHLLPATAQTNHTTAPPVKPNLVQAEYYIDTDPGYGLATSIPITSDTNISNQAININPASLTQGVHRVGIRARDANGAWSLDNSWLFYKPYSSSTIIQPPPALPNITSVEYYVDNDPGYGKGISVSVTPGTDLSNLMINLDPSPLSQGVHRIGIRARDANGAWSLDNSWLFYKPYSSTSVVQPPPPLPNITSVEYYVDNDPGYGKGISVSVTPGTDLSDLVFNLDPGPLTQGVHRIGIRARDANGAWSLDNSWIFYKPYSATASIQPPPPLPNVTRVEYYVDADPGYGKGISIPITPGTNLADLTINLDPGPLTTGVHRIGIRAQDAYGAWSLDNSWLFYKPAAASNIQPPPALPDIVQTEYYFDTDPGYGKGHPIALDAGKDIGNFSIPLDISGLPVGNHVLYIRSKDSYGAWSLDNKFSFSVQPPGALDIVVGNVPSQLCTGGSFKLPFTTSGTYAAANVFTAQLSDAAGGFSHPTNIGTLTSDHGDSIAVTIPSGITPGNNYRIRIIANNPADTSSNASTDIRIARSPQNSLGILGNTNVCHGTETYAILYPESGVTYHWQLSGGGTIDTSGSLSAVVHWTQAGTYSLTLSNSTACGAGTQTTIQVRVSTGVPTDIPTATSSGQSLYSSGYNSSTGYTGYQWFRDGVAIPGANDYSYFATVTGDYSVAFTNACGVGPTSNSIHISFININSFAPAATTVGNTVTIKGAGFTGATSVSFNGIVAATFTVVNDSTITVTVPAGASSGRIAVVAPIGTVYSSTNFVVAAPPYPVTLISPSNGAKQVPYIGDLRWNPALNNPDGYKVYLGTDSSHLPLVAMQTNTFYSYALSPDSLYYWEIVPYNTYGNTTTAATWSFTTKGLPPNCAVIPDPVDGATGIALHDTLRWSSGGGSPTGYYVKWGANINNAPQYGTTGTSQIVNLVSNTTYSWQVMPYNQNGTPTGCPVWTFTTVICNTPVITAGGPTTLCKDQQVTLTASSGLRYHWNTGDTTQSITVSTTGHYYAVVDSLKGCSVTTNTITVSVDPKPLLSTGAGQGICQGDSILLTFAGLQTTHWSTGDTLPSITVHPSVTTTYYVQGTSAAGCHYSDSTRINVNPSLPAGSVTNMLPADNTLDVELPFNLSWLPGDNTTKYDLYIWQAGASQPATPFARDITAINYTLENAALGTTYHWQVVAKNGNCFSTPGPIQSFTTKDLPDLQVTSVTAPSLVASGQPISITWTVQNTGNGSTGSTPWLDHIWLSADTILQDNPPATDFYLGGVPNASALEAGKGYTNTASFTVPNGIAGSYHVIVKTNQLGTQSPVSAFAEKNNQNNQIISDALQINLTPPPDLQVTNIITPINAFSGLTVSVSWTVTNIGADMLNAGVQWKDNLYLSFSPTFSTSTATFLGSFPHTGALLNGKSYTNSGSITIPKYISGLYYIYVVTDAGNQVYEEPFETNNVSSDVINLYLTPPPDLAVQSVTAPATASSGSSIPISWTVKNAGANSTDNQWQDFVYLSAKGNYDLSDAVVVGYSSSPNALNAGDSYNRQIDITIPPGFSGPYYLYVKTNADHRLFEYDNLQNNILRSDTTLLINTADLTVDSITAPPTANSGENITIAYRVNNQGNGDVLNAYRVDNVYISTQPTFSISTATRVGSQGFTESLAAGSASFRQATITLPQGISGNYYVFVITDVTNNIYEGANEGNNTGRGSTPMAISLSPYPDLTVQQVHVPDTAHSGFLMPISFTVKNNGSIAAAGTTWKDNVYISSSPTWVPSSSVRIATLTHTQSLGSNAAYTISDSIKVPVDNYGRLSAGGQLLDSTSAYIYVFTDADDQLYEYHSENNNILAGTPVFIIPPRIDLELTDVYSSDSAHAGQIATVWWTVRNNGISTDYKGLQVPCYWYDGVYLSKDTVWDPSDLFVTDWGYSNTKHDSSYSDRRNFVIPKGLSGNYYLLMVVDHKFNIHEDVNRANNYRPIREEEDDPEPGKPEQIKVLPSDYPDLQLTQFAAPAGGKAGQPVTVKWTTRNNGVGASGAQGWEDGIFLSKDNVLDAGDILLRSKGRPGNLLPGQSYDDSLEVTLPITASGNYVLIVATDYHNDIFEDSAENNNTKYSFINIAVPLPSDLSVDSISMPATGIAGASIHIQYTVRNTGSYPATGVMSDGIYLSKDTIWDISDPLIGTVKGNINLAPAGILTRSLTVPLTGAVLGNYHIIVRTDLLNNIPEINEDNNEQASDDSIRITVNQLPLNVLTPDTLYDSTYLYYRVDIPDSLKKETLLITLKGDSIHATNELYARLNDVPSRAVFDFNQGTVRGGNQEVLIPSLSAGSYYIAAYGDNSLSSSQPVTLYASILPFAIRSVNSSKGGNTGSVTIALNGSKFEPGMQVQLNNGAGTVLTALQVYYTSSTQVFASFDLRGQPLGLYDVIATKTDHSQAILSKGFEILAGTGGGFYTNTAGGTAGPGCDPHAANGINSQVQVGLQYPASTRRQRVIAITVFFGNAGNVDIPTPTRFVYSTEGAPLSFDVAGLSQNLQQLRLEFKEANGPPNILRPGATGSITFYTKAVAPLEFILTDN